MTYEVKWVVDLLTLRLWGSQVANIWGYWPARPSTSVSNELLS